MIDVDELISLVHQKKAIWDKRLPEHTKRHSIEKRWQEISVIMKEDGEYIGTLTK